MWGEFVVGAVYGEFGLCGASGGRWRRQPSQKLP